MTALCPHWIPEHRSADDRATFARWRPPFIKIICVDEKPPYLEDVPAGAQIIIRNHPLSENYGQGRTFADMTDAKRQGNEAAEAAGRMAAYCEAKGMSQTRLLFEGRNEPQLWAGEPPALVAEYERARLVRLHALGLHGVIGNFGVGWPGNGGVANAPVQWGFFNPAIAEMQPGDYLGLHEYWALAGPGENWRWWAGRYQQCPYGVPILITECGIDLGVAGQPYGGWQNLPGNEEQRAATYVSQLAQYEAELRKDARIKGACIFTFDYGSNHWELMNTRNAAFLAQFLPYAASQPDTTQPQPPATSGPLPEQEPATDIATLAQKVRWWLEEYQRQVEQGNTARAAAILDSLTKRGSGLLYRLENIAAVSPAPPDASQSTSVTSYSQRDPKWASTLLGTSGGKTIGEAGCLVTAVASMLTDYGKPFDPGQLNVWLKAHNGYDGNLFRWYSLVSLGVWLMTLNEYPYPRVAPVEPIRQALVSGQMVIAKVDAKPGPPEDEHWVRILGVSDDDSDADIMDPWQMPGGELGRLSQHYTLPGWKVGNALFAVAIYDRD